MTVYDLISKWIREAQVEQDIAKANQNTFKPLQLIKTIRKLKELKDLV